MGTAVMETLNGVESCFVGFPGSIFFFIWGYRGREAALVLKGAHRKGVWVFVPRSVGDIRAWVLIKITEKKSA